MGKIRMLSDHVASQVAAGEVVERPASVVKELVENSIDAGAKRVTVEFHRGGTQLMRVVDDGSVMDREDALLSLERHATSKIRTADDLARVLTMGFRGEALPSIASISRFRMQTRTAEGEAGTEIVVAGGKIESVGESGCPVGTAIEVTSLFYNIPARKKFLRGEETESARIVQQMQALALAHPGVAMTLLRDGRRLWQAAGATASDVRIRDVFGPDFLSKLQPIERTEENGIVLSGFLAKPGEGRPDKDWQFVVLNGRVVHCPPIAQSLREAYAEVLPKGRHPLAVLYVSMDPLAYDCNVHPAKREVRIHRPDILRQAVYRAARAHCESSRRIGLVPPVRVPESPAIDIEEPAPPRPPVNPAGREPSAAAMVAPPSKAPEVPRPRPPADQIPLAPESPEQSVPFRLIGPLGEHWILLEGADGLVLVDVRSAAERICFETLRREMEAGGVAVQKLLLPSVVEVTPSDAVWITQHVEELRAVGFSLEPFGGDSFKIESLPSCVADRDAHDLLLGICQTIRHAGGVDRRQNVIDEIVRSVSHFSVPRRTVYREESARRLVDQLLRCELPYACPQGRPTMIQWSWPELEKKFGR